MNPLPQESFVRWLRQVTPYVHAFRGRTFVVGFGGEIFAERARFASFIHDVNLLAALGIRLVLVHGARPQIDAVAIVRRLDAGEVVLVPHLGYSPTGEVFNLAWENVAENVAVALKADKLLMYSDKLPLDRKDEVISELTEKEARGFLSRVGK